MKFSAAALCALAASNAVVSAKNTADKDAYTLPDGVLKFDFEGKRAAKHPLDRYNKKFSKIGKRDSSTSGTVQATLDNNQFSFYSSLVEIGTPFQKVNLLIDTGSSDLWAISANNKDCAKNNQELNEPGFISCADGTFNEDKSSTFKKNASSTFSIQYVDTTGAQGFWGTDRVQVGGSAILENCSVGIGETSNSSQGVFGIGFPQIESTNSGGPGSYTYANVPVLLQQQGFTKAHAFSLWLNDVDAKTGSVLFGGVDHSKYTGSLTKVPMALTVEGFDVPVELAIYLSDIGVKQNGKVQNIFSANVPALLDSGTTLTYLPTQVFQTIGEALQGQYSQEVGTYLLPCDTPADSSLEYNFNGAVVDVPFSSLTIPLTDENGNQALFDDGTAACGLAVQPSDQELILGDSFLQSVYAVYDLDNREIALAAAVANATDSNVEVISNGIPSATSASGYDNTQLQLQATFNSANLQVATTGGGLQNSAVLTEGLDTTMATATGDLTATATGSASSASSTGGSTTASSHKSGSSNMAAPVLACVLVAGSLLALF